MVKNSKKEAQKKILAYSAIKNKSVLLFYQVGYKDNVGSDPDFVKKIVLAKNLHPTGSGFATLQYREHVGQTVETLKIGLGMWGGGEEAQKV